MKKQAKFKHLTEQEYAAAKWMLTNKNKSQVAKTLGRSTATLSYIDRSTSYEDYRRILSELNERTKAQKAAKVAQAPKASDYIPVEQTISVPAEDMAKLFTLIAEIDKKLDQVVVAKRRFF